MDNSAGWGSYSLVNAYIWVWFGLIIGIGFFENPWTAVMYAVWAMAINIVARKVISAINQSRHTVVGLDDAGTLTDGDSLVEDFGALGGEDDVVVMANDDKIKIEK
tara:strand:+ start:456 stop:773 length:318 start_codon:yes stop_codon:yes gene_type:complete